MHILPKTKQSGLTLVETMFAVAIVAMLAGFASSSVSAAVQAAHSSSGLSSLIAALTRARSSAANLAVDVVLCPSRDGASCSAGDHWESGWIAFAATHSGSDRTSDEPILLRQQALAPKVHLVTSAGRTRIRFQPSGGNAGSNATFTLCDGRGSTKATAYAMANNGNLHSTTPDAAYVADACAGI
ncbi:MAG: prepilin-type N-terminal cleavage/methylation domain-containing protein [Gammaproteobacteria bacterium]|nr:MAG: prepilin-type N-terminal cleavage/methylation domain-containing protein [Gammaproteobacteria bacterium]